MGGVYAGGCQFDPFSLLSATVFSSNPVAIRMPGVSQRSIALTQGPSAARLRHNRTGLTSLQAAFSTPSCVSYDDDTGTLKLSTHTQPSILKPMSTKYYQGQSARMFTTLLFMKTTLPPLSSAHYVPCSCLPDSTDLFRLGSRTHCTPDDNIEPESEGGFSRVVQPSLSHLAITISAFGVSVRSLEENTS